jgi:hypothetical protein
LEESDSNEELGYPGRLSLATQQIPQYNQSKTRSGAKGDKDVENIPFRIIVPLN